MAKFLTYELAVQDFGKDIADELYGKIGGKEKMNNNLFEIEYMNLGNGYCSWWTKKTPKLKSDIVKLEHLVKNWNERVYRTNYKDTYIDFTIRVDTTSGINMLFLDRDFNKDTVHINLYEINEDDETLVDTVNEETMKKFLLFIDFMNETDVNDLKYDIIREIAIENTLNSEYDKVEKPQHYMLNIKGNEIQVIDIIDEIVKDYEPQEAFKIANVIKYILRASKKNGKEDLRKAKKYIDMLIGGENE